MSNRPPAEAVANIVGLGQMREGSLTISDERDGIICVYGLVADTPRISYEDDELTTWTPWPSAHNPSVSIAQVSAGGPQAATLRRTTNWLPSASEPLFIDLGQSFVFVSSGIVRIDAAGPQNSAWLIGESASTFIYIKVRVALGQTLSREQATRQLVALANLLNG